MSVILFLIPISLSLSVLFVVLCLRSIRAGQFDDLESPRWRMLFDSEEPPIAAPLKKTGPRPALIKEISHD